MNDADLELRVASWLRSDAATWGAPDTLRRRVLDLPGETAPRAAWWHRFATLPAMSGAVAAVGLAAILVSTSFFSLFDGPAGADGEACNNRQVQRALDELRDADGYRYLSTEQTRVLDPDAEISFDDPVFVWRDAWVSEGAYLAPDRAHDLPITRTDQLDRGYLEHLQVDGHTYQLREIDGEPTWVEQENWPTANWVWGYLANQFPTFSIPGVTALSWDAEVPADLPGVGGCTAAARLPADYAMPGRIAALRVDVGTGRVMTAHLGPAADVRANEGDTRSSWEVTWELPSADEFVAPADPQPDPNEVPSSATPAPTPTPVPVGPDAWQPVALPLSPDVERANSISVMGVAHGDRWVAIGSAFGDDGSVPAIWTSVDGVTWVAVDDLDALGDLSPSGIAWDGTEYLLIGSRDHATEEGAWDSFRPESWVSRDGVAWEEGGPIGPTMGSGEVANPERPVATGSGWVAGGSIFTQTEAGQDYRPAFFWSEDGRDWTTVELEGTRTGRVASPVVLPGGTLVSLGCESPSAGSTGTGDCYIRPWSSEDGIAWTAGDLVERPITNAVAWDGRIFALEADEPVGEEWPNGGIVDVSDDGQTWQPWAELPEGGSPGRLHVVGERLVVEASVMTDGGNSRPIAWRNGEDGTWQRIELAPPVEGSGMYLGEIVDSDAGMVVLGFTSDNETGAGEAYLWIEP